MRGWQIILMVVLLSSVVLAQECTDTDGGGAKASESSALMTKGEVKYGLTTQVDTCLTSEDGVSTASGIWLKEYYCSSNQRLSHSYDCTKYGYDKCQDGECVGGSSSGSSSGTNATPVPQPQNYCGNKIREKDKGEECDPPNSICFGKTSQEYGTCQADCTCKIAQAALENIRELPPDCGDGFKHPDEDCEEDADCPSDHVCSSCKCVKELTPEEIERMKQEALAKKGEKEEEVKAEIEEEFKAPPLPEVDLTAKNFSEEPAIKATSGIAGFFRKIFAWLAGIFS